MTEFDLDELRKILKDCSQYESGHHLGRPFMSAYEIAIRFAEAHPQHPQASHRKVGGRGTGPQQSLAQRIARFLSADVKHGTATDIQGGFLPHELVGDLWFNSCRVRFEPSGSSAQSIFRYVDSTR